MTEQLLGLLAALVLRMPNISAAAAEAGAVEVLAEVLSAAPTMAAEAKRASGASAAAAAAAKAATAEAADGNDETAAAAEEEAASRVFGVGASDGGGGGPAAAQRQACMALRNMVVRNAELRPAFLAAGCEGLLRSVKALFPAACKDVGSAALRDLGCDDYNA